MTNQAKALALSTECIRFLSEKAALGKEERSAVVSAAVTIVVADAISMGLPAMWSQEATKQHLFSFIDKIWRSGSNAMGAIVSMLMIKSIAHGDKDFPDLMRGLLEHICAQSDACTGVDKMTEKLGMAVKL